MNNMQIIVNKNSFERGNGVQVRMCSGIELGDGVMVYLFWDSAAVGD